MMKITVEKVILRDDNRYGSDQTIYTQIIPDMSLEDIVIAIQGLIKQTTSPAQP